eukprot:5633104-Amphidinium_carterae.1
MEQGSCKHKAASCCVTNVALMYTCDPRMTPIMHEVSTYIVLPLVIHALIAAAYSCASTRKGDTIMIIISSAKSSCQWTGFSTELHAQHSSEAWYRILDFLRAQIRTTQGNCFKPSQIEGGIDDCSGAECIAEFVARLR